MKISELISQLLSLKEDYGDIPIVLFSKRGKRYSSMLIDHAKIINCGGIDVAAIKSEALDEELWGSES